MDANRNNRAEAALPPSTPDRPASSARRKTHWAGRVINKKGLFRLLLYRTGPAACLACLIAFAPAGMAAETPFCSLLSSKESFPFYGLCLPVEAAPGEAGPDGGDFVPDEGGPASEDPVSDGDGSGIMEGEGLEEEEYYEEDPIVREWPEDGIALRIPVPDMNLDTLFVQYVSEHQFDASLDLTEEDYQRYIGDCRAGGFALDEDYTESRDEARVSLRFYALDSEGYKLELNYNGEPGAAGNMYIKISAPIALHQIQWPDRALGLLVPVPPTTLGVIGGAPEIFLMSYLGNMSKDVWHAYIEACKEAGFDQNISETATTFSSEDSDGIQLTLNYEGANIVYFNLFDPEQKWRSKGPGGRDEDSQGETPSPAEEGTTTPGADPEGFVGSGENESGSGGLPAGEEPANSEPADDHRDSQQAPDPGDPDTGSGQPDPFGYPAPADFSYDPGSNAASEGAAFADLPYEEPAFIDLPDLALPLSSDPSTEANAAADLNHSETDTAADIDFTGPDAGTAAGSDSTDPDAGTTADIDLTDPSTDPAAEADLAESSGDPSAETTFSDPAPETAVTTYAQAPGPLTDPSYISEKEREGLPVPGSIQTLAAASYQGSTASSLDSRQTGSGQPASANGRAGSEDRQPVSGRTNGSPAASYRENAGKTEGVFLLSAKAAQKLETGLTGDGAADLYDPFQDSALADTYGLLMQEARLRASPSGSAAAASGKPSAGSAPENSLAGFLAALLAVMAVTAGAVTRKVRFRNSLR